MEFDLENPIMNYPEHKSDTISTLFAAESDHMPSENYYQSFKSRDFDVSIRTETMSLILKGQFCFNVDPFVPYLAVNYLDRFISTQGMLQGKPWIMRLLAISCLSLAAKMKKTRFSLTDFQREEGFIFDTETIRRMELLILGALNWRMRSITPFSFLHFFISFFKLKDPPLIQALKDRATEIIIEAQKETKLLVYKPSVIAASALLSSSHELFPVQFPCFEKAISSCSYVNKENLFDCCNVMQGIVMDGYEPIFDLISSSETPNNVLDRHFSSSESDKTSDIRSEREVKRRKVSDFCNETFQLSQIQQC